MNLKSLLKPSESVAVSFVTAGAVFVAYQTSLPSFAEVYACMPHSQSTASGQRKAMFLSAGIVTGAFLLTKDANVFVVGGATFLALEWMYRHANAAHPESGKVVPSAPPIDMGYPQSGDVDPQDEDNYGWM